MRPLANGDVELRVSGPSGRFEYLITTSGTTTLKYASPPSRLFRFSRVIAGAGLLAVLTLPVWGVLNKFGLVGEPTWWATGVFVGFILLVLGLLGARWSERRDPFLRSEPGKERSVGSVPAEKEPPRSGRDWIALTKSALPDDDGDDD